MSQEEECVCMVLDEIIQSEKSFLNIISKAQSNLFLLLNQSKDLKMDSECEKKLKFIHDQLIVFLNTVKDVREFMVNQELFIAEKNCEQKLLEICELYLSTFADREYVYCFNVMVVNYYSVLALLSTLANNPNNFRIISKLIHNYDNFKSFPVYFCGRIPKYCLLFKDLLKCSTKYTDQLRNIVEITSELGCLINRQVMVCGIAKGLEDYHPIYKLYLGCSVKIIPLKNSYNIFERLFQKSNIVEYSDTMIVMADRLNIFMKSKNTIARVTNLSSITECIECENSGITHEYYIVKSANVKEFNKLKNEFNWKMSIFKDDNSQFIEIRNDDEIILINFKCHEEECIKLWNYLIVERSERSLNCKIPITLFTQQSLQLSDITIITRY